MRRRPRVAVLAVLLTVVAACALAAAACGGDEDLTEGLSSEEILESSREAAAQVATYHAHVTLTLDLTASGSAPPEGILGRFVGRPVTIVADGPVRRPIGEGGSAFSFDLDIELGGFDVQGR